MLVGSIKCLMKYVKYVIVIQAFHKLLFAVECFLFVRFRGETTR